VESGEPRFIKTIPRFAIACILSFANVTEQGHFIQHSPLISHD
jgi:hypothetical protein